MAGPHSRSEELRESKICGFKVGTQKPASSYANNVSCKGSWNQSACRKTKVVVINTGGAVLPALEVTNIPSCKDVEGTWSGVVQCWPMGHRFLGEHELMLLSPSSGMVLALPLPVGY